ncbi:hypothetical protein [Carnobacterium divergens]|uniref:hypothetical protein n=1 Tax=Carnobacterium divergens TaxID=2748 RepID=UPI002892D3F4|nr:hypothetical protein [Carnobacterium divergens]
MKSIAEYRQDELAGTKLVKIKKVEILFIKVISQLIICSILWNLSELYAWKIFVTVLSALTFNALFIAVYELKELFKKM